MVQISLECAVVGCVGTFDVTIDDDTKVSKFKEAIKEKNEGIKCTARVLQLFLAKQPVEEGDEKEIVPVYRPSAEGMKEERLKWLSDKHRAALKLINGESDDYINTLTAGEQIMASTTLATWFYEKNNMDFPSSGRIHLLVVVPKTAGGGQELESMLSRDALTTIQESTARMWRNVAKEFREQYRKQAEELRGHHCQLAERFNTLERALNPPMPSKFDSQLGEDHLNLLLKFGCVSGAEEAVGADAFWSVEIQTQVDCIETEDLFDAFITPYFNNVLDSLDVVFVNSKSYEWLPQSTLGNSTTNLKPNGFVTHRGMYHKERELDDDVSRVDTSFRFGKAVKALFDCLILFESKITKHLGGAPFGQVMRYIQHVFPKGPGSAVLFNRTTFWLINSINGGVVRVIKATWVMEGSKALFRDFITKNLSPLNVDVVEGGPFLGSGAFGRVFKVKQVDQNGDMLALKIVEESSVGRLFQEQDALVSAQYTGLTIRVVEAATEMSDGAAMLLSPAGGPICYPTTSQEVRSLYDMLWDLHSAGIVHGDPRVPNVIIKDDECLWIDLVEGRIASPLLVQNDAKILTQSILHVFPNGSLGLELETLIKNYGANPTQSNLDLLAVEVSSVCDHQAACS